MAGAIIILMACIISMLGYQIMPDSTPDANDGAVQIQKKPPGFKATFIRIRKNYKIPRNGFIKKAVYGQENAYTLIPVQKYRISDDTVYYEEYGSKGGQKSLSIITAVYSIQFDLTSGLKNGRTIEVEGEDIRYINHQGRVVHTSVDKTVDLFKKNNVITRRYILGTDRSGRDLFSRLIFGTRISLSIGFVAVLISLMLGLSLGSLAGFFGGKIDDFILWFMSVIWSIPGIMLVIAISMALQTRGVWVAFVAVGLTMWVETARVVRGQIFGIKEKSYIEAARALGLRNFRIMYVHILPNIIGPLIVIATANFAAAILLEAGLSFLGLSVQPPTPSWGSMIFEGFSVLGTKNSWHLVVFPGLAISLMVLSFNLLGNGLRDAIDPKTVTG